MVTITEGKIEFESAQDCFDYVVSKVIEQGEKSITASEGVCQYRSKKDGKTLKCAMGFCIPDSVYKPSMEGNLAGSLIEGVSGLKHLREYRYLLLALQSAHDKADKENFIFSFKRRAYNIAEHHDLNPALAAT